LHVVTISAGPFVAGNLIGFTTGVLLTLVLLVLTLRAAKLPGTPLANIGFSVCALLWSLGGLLNVILSAAGFRGNTTAVLIAQAIQFTGACAFPIPVLAIWRPFATLSWQREAARFLRIASWTLASAAAILIWTRVLRGADWISLTTLHLSAALGDTLLLVVGVFTGLRVKATPRAVYLPSIVIVAAVFTAMLSMAVGVHVHHSGLWGGIASHLVLVMFLCAFFLFARFRYADVFIRYGVRILLAGIWAAVLSFFAQSQSFMHVAVRASAPWAVHVFGVILVANVLLLSFTFIDERISALVNRWLFHTPDYRAARRGLAVRLAELSGESAVSAAVEKTARETLDLSVSEIKPLDETNSWPPALVEGELVELDRGHLLLPVSSSGRITHVLQIAPGPLRPGLVTRDLDFLRGIVTLCGNRLDALHRESETIERQNRETVLEQQVTEAELRALRAQVNPHFLFNSLNTVADLIVRDPPRAETMTLRLASVFRHVLANSSRPLTTIRDEMEFLRTYLHIEETRFGDRLQVEFRVDPAVANEHIPSLLLQPLVENALKHGLGPKPETGHLWISAQPAGTHVELRVEDDGLGLSKGPNGLGLTNVADRLSAMYHDQASITIEPRDSGGTRVSVRIPRDKAVETV